MRCPYCLEEIARDLDLCPRCEEPLTAVAEMDMAPPESVERLRELRKAKSLANQALTAAILAPFVCFILLAPAALAYAYRSILVYERHGERPPATAIAAIVIALIALLGCCGVLWFRVTSGASGF